MVNIVDEKEYIKDRILNYLVKNNNIRTPGLYKPDDSPYGKWSMEVNIFNAEREGRIGDADECKMKLKEYEEKKEVIERILTEPAGISDKEFNALIEIYNESYDYSLDESDILFYGTVFKRTAEFPNYIASKINGDQIKAFLNNKKIKKMIKEKKIKYEEPINGAHQILFKKTEAQRKNELKNVAEVLTDNAYKVKDLLGILPPVVEARKYVLTKLDHWEYVEDAAFILENVGLNKNSNIKDIVESIENEKFEIWQLNDLGKKYSEIKLVIKFGDEYFKTLK